MAVNLDEVGITLGVYSLFSMNILGRQYRHRVPIGLIGEDSVLLVGITPIGPTTELLNNSVALSTRL